ncbi:MAG: aliphatic sulfonate ABC transporter substrate-binding protein [Proteobacteria bacterium]|nr:aliphatic sulfonate ABC transporter substrate-binding protein [Pseudomonadota bacterium]
MITKRHLLAAGAASLAVPGLLGRAHAQEPPKEIRIGYQKSGVLLIAKEQELFEKRFKSIGASVKWVEFTFGPPLLEALNTGNIDYGTVGDTPPIFAQAARANLLYVATLPGRGNTQAIVVPKDSPIRKLEDLKGKKVAIARASSAHNFTIAALESVGLSFNDIQPQYLPPADAAAAFTRGSIDAWTIWDPFYALAELNRDARPLPVKPEAAAQNSYFLANKDFTQKHPGIVSAINDELAKATNWASTNRDQAAKLFAQASGVELAAQQRTVARTEFNFLPLNDAIATQQQAIADRFHRLGLIPKAINIRDIIWVWKPSA